MEPKIVSMPTFDSLIKYNLTFYCSIGHPTVMFKASKAELVCYQENQELMEDYDLWLRLASSGKIIFANLGQSLVVIRKHLDNKSTGVPIEAEIPLKIAFLGDLMRSQNKVLASVIEEDDLLCEEFIRVTGRPIRSETFSNLKHRAGIDQIFQCLIAIYKKAPATSDMEKLSI
jgi:hypothetical protein